MDRVFHFLNDNKDAVTSIGIILTFLVSVISLNFSTRNNRALHYTNTVTKNRVEWIYRLRELCSEFISLVNTDANYFLHVNTEEDSEKVGKQFLKVKQLGIEIEFMLNFFDSIDKEIIDCVNKLVENYNVFYFEIILHNNEENVVNEKTDIADRAEKEIEKNIIELKKWIKIYLKSEWNRVKYESQGKIYEKETQEFDIQELERKYDDPRYKNNVWKRFGINFCAKAKRIFNSVGFACLLIGIALFALILQIIIA